MVFLLVLCAPGITFETFAGECRTVQLYDIRSECRAAARRTNLWADARSTNSQFFCIRGPGVGK